MLETSIQHTSDVIYGPQVRQKGNQVSQFCVMWVVEPRRDRYGIIRMEDIGSRGIVQYDRVSYWTTELR